MTVQLLTDEKMISLLPTIIMGNDKPKEQQWFTRSEVLKIMRGVEEAIQKTDEKSFVSPIPLG